MNAGSTAAQAAWPAALRQAVRGAPVVLYTTAGCAPCDEGRTLLRSRGVPVREQRIETEADLKALQALNIPSAGFPVLMVGSERAIGYEQGQWTRMLDAAQYPTTAVLPRDWQPEPATNLAGNMAGNMAGNLTGTSGAPADRTAPTEASAGGSNVGSSNNDRFGGPTDATAQTPASGAVLTAPAPSARPGSATQSAPSQSGSSRIRF